MPLQPSKACFHTLQLLYPYQDIPANKIKKTIVAMDLTMQNIYGGDMASFFTPLPSISKSAKLKQAFGLGSSGKLGA